jgi:hypothetical protein
MNTNGNNNYNRPAEKSKTFKRLGALVGIKATSKTQRGIIARTYLKRIKKEQLQRIEQGLSNYIDLKVRAIPVKVAGEIVSYI